MQQLSNKKNANRLKSSCEDVVENILKKRIVLKSTWLIVIFLLSAISLKVAAVEKYSDIETNTKEFSMLLGASRLIYNPSSAGESLTVSNTHDYPILVQSRTFAEDMKSKSSFVVTPPLFRLDAQQQNRLRIIRVGGDFADDRESIQWLCVKGIPPKEGAFWAKDGKPEVAKKKVSLNVQLSVESCIKLIVRPGSITGHPDDVASSLVWYHEGNQLKVVNNTPFYMNLSSLKVGGEDLHDIHYVPPLSFYNFTLPKGIQGKVSWSVINDYGGVSKTYQSDIQ